MSKNLDLRVQWYDKVFCMRALENKIEHYDWRPLVRSYGLQKVQNPDLYFIHFIAVFASAEEREFLKVANWDEIMLFTETVNELNADELRKLINHIQDVFSIFQGTESEHNKQILEKVIEMVRKEKEGK